MLTANNQAIADRLPEATRRLESWLVSQALPLWAEAGIDSRHGCVYEALLADGTPDTAANKRIRVQARQIFAFAMAASMGWYQHAEKKIAGIERFLRRRAAHPDSAHVYVHLVSGSNQIIDARQDTYDLAFFLLAKAWQFRAFKDERAVREAEAIVAHIDDHLKGNPGGWLEGDYAVPFRRQNPHMHLFEAFLSLFDATRDGKWLARAGEIFTLFETRFYEPENRVLLEYFDHRWNPLRGQNGTIVEPGHMLEWVWLLHWYAQRSGSPVSQYTDALYTQALDIGVDSTSGLLFDEVTPSGRVLKKTKRCWPLTELIKANIARARAGHIDCEDKAAQAIDLLFTHYLSAPIPGAYYDQRGADNEITVDKAPASTLYHLVVAARECVNYCTTTQKSRSHR